MRFIFIPDEETVNIINLHTVDIPKWLMKPGNVYIGRKTKYTPASKWGNPTKVSDVKSHAKAVCMFEEYLCDNAVLLNSVYELKDKVLGCWCSPKPCHGEILHRYAGNNPVHQMAGM